MKPDKKPGLAVLIGQLKPKGESDKQEEPMGADEGLHAAMEEFIAAVKSDDVAGAVEAFKSLFEQSEMQPHAEAEHE